MVERKAKKTGDWFNDFPLLCWSWTNRYSCIATDGGENFFFDAKRNEEEQLKYFTVPKKSDSAADWRIAAVLCSVLPLESQVIAAL